MLDIFILGLGDLASIPDQTTTDFLKEKIAFIQGTWVGGFKDIATGVWKWMDGTPFSYDNWAVKQPNGDGNHIELQPWNKMWNDLEEYTEKHYLCQYDTK